jgi:hypothetical protein
MSLSKRYFEQQAAATTPAQKLTRAREQVRTAEAITANLLAAVRTMEEVTMTVAVTERMVR